MFGAEIDRLLLDARAGSARALGQLIERTEKDLRTAANGVLARRRRTRVSADEVFADALAAVVRDIGSLRATSYVGFRYWFTSITRNQLRSALRRSCSRPRECAPVEPEARATEPLAHRPSEGELVRDALLGMPASQRIAYVLREGFGLTWRTIGFVAGRRAPSAARLLHYRGSLRARGAVASRPELRLFVPAIRA